MQSYQHFNYSSWFPRHIYWTSQHNLTECLCEGRAVLQIQSIWNCVTWTPSILSYRNISDMNNIDWLYIPKDTKIFKAKINLPLYPYPLIVPLGWYLWLLYYNVFINSTIFGSNFFWKWIVFPIFTVATTPRGFSSVDTLI